MQDEERAKPSGFLRDLLIAARFVDNGLVDLEKRLMSVEGLVPHEDNKEEAAAVAQRILHDVKELEGNIGELKNTYKHLYDTTKEENDKADLSIKLMREGIDQIEGMFKDYGYDSSNMPEYIPEDIPEDTADDLSEEGDNNGNISESSESSVEEVMPVAIVVTSPTPEHKVDAWSESLLGVEITPMLLKHKKDSQGSGQASSNRVTPNSVTPNSVTPNASSKENRVPVRCPSKVPSPVSLKKIPSAKKTKILEKPVRPVLSGNY